MLAAVLCVFVLAPAVGGATAAETFKLDVSVLRLEDVTSGPMLSVRGPVSPVRGPRGVLGSEDMLLEALAGARGKNRVVVCGGCSASPSASRGPCLPQRCPGVTWRRRWALVRAACVAGLQLGELRVLRTSSHERTCDLLDDEPLLIGERARRAVRGRVHPLWQHDARYDAALLELHRAFPEEEPLLNATTADRFLEDIKYWMQKTDEDSWYWRSLDTKQYTSNVTFYTLFMVGILPATTLFVFFLFVTFCTGTPVQVQYANIKEGIKTPWLLDEYPSDVKCFPTYGQV